MLSRKIACPSCDARLKIAENVSEDTMITCPKCHIGFPAPSANGHSANEPEEAPRRATRSHDDDEDESGRERRVVRKKFRKKKPAASKAPLIIGLVIAIVIVVGGGGAVAAFFLWPKKAQTVADNNPPKSAPNPNQSQTPNQPPQGTGAGTAPPAPDTGGGSAPSGPGAASAAFPSGPSAGAGVPPMNQGGDTAAPASPATPPARGAGQSDEFAAGKRVYSQNCTRCHTIGGEGASGGPGRKRDLSGVGADHNADWLAKFVRDPQATKRGSKMQGFGNRLSDADIRAVANYLASLK